MAMKRKRIRRISKMKSGLKTVTKNKMDKTVTKFTKTKIRHK